VQDFWASSGYRLLERKDGGVAATDAWLARFLERDELLPPDDAGERERELHARLLAAPRASVPAAALAAVEDPDARENWAQFLLFRDRLLSHPTIEAAYADLFRRDAVDLAPAFVDAMVQAITRGILEGCGDPWLMRAGEMLFRRQRLSTEEGQLLCGDAATLEVYAETGGFGNMGRLLRQQNTALPAVKMDVMNNENAQLYLMRDELFGFVLDLTPGREGAAAFARVLERWIAHMAGAAVTISPERKIEDERWRWHVGLDVDSTAILNALYRREEVDAGELERLAVLFRLEFRDAADVTAEMAGRPVYLGLACRPDRTLKVKPQNLLINLPLRNSASASRG
jgi:hypothetical protein